MRSVILHFNVSDADIELYEKVVRSYGYEPTVQEINPNQACALLHKLNGYSNLWVNVPFGNTENHLTTRAFRPYSPADAQRKAGNLVASAIRAVLDIDPKTIAFILGSSNVPAPVRHVITAASNGLPAIGSVMMSDEDRCTLLAALK